MESLQQPKSLVDQAYEVILNALCDGTLNPDERLTQEEIAARLNVSRQPVTHALAVLKAQGFLAQTGRRGLTVTAIKPEFFQAIYQLRTAVEPLAVSLAIPRLDDAAKGAANAIIARGRDMVARQDPGGGLAADIDFHAFIYDLSGNTLIADSMRLHWHHLRRAKAKARRNHPAQDRPRPARTARRRRAGRQRTLYQRFGHDNGRGIRGRACRDIRGAVRHHRTVFRTRGQSARA